MPLKISSGDRKLLIIGTAILVLLIVVGAVFTPQSGSEVETPSSYSTASGGGKAAYLLLKESGYNIERWEHPPLELPEGKGSTLLLLEPSSVPTPQEIAKLRRFVETGGTLIISGYFSSLMIPKGGTIPDPMNSGVWEQYKANAPSAITRSAPELTLSAEERWKADLPAIPLYSNGDKIVAVKYPHGEGEIIWLGGSTPFTNAGVKEGRNLNFLLAAVGEKDTTKIFWDEYFHGYRGALSGTLVGKQMKWVYAQIAVIVFIVLLTYSRRSGPIRPEWVRPRTSPLEFVETLGGLYETAGAASVAVDVYQQRFRYWVTRRLGMAVDSSIEDIERSVRERWRFSDPKFGATLREAQSVKYHQDLDPKEALRLVQALHEFAKELKLFPAIRQEKH